MTQTAQRAVNGATLPAPVAAHGANTLDAYLATGYQAINGWLWMPAVEATLALASIQREHAASGPICEIGVWEGRYLTLLSFLPETPQKVLGIDPLIHSGDRDGQRARLQANIDRYAWRPDLVALLERSSADVSAAEIVNRLGAPCQFVSVDGDHTAAGALHDLHLAERILAPGGIVAVDDVPNMGCPGVFEAVIRYGLEAEAGLAPFLHVSNKLFMTQRDWCGRYSQALLAHARTGAAGEWGRKMVDHVDRMARLHVPVQLLGQDVLVATV